MVCSNGIGVDQLSMQREKQKKKTKSSNSPSRHSLVGLRAVTRSCCVAVGNSGRKVIWEAVGSKEAPSVKRVVEKTGRSSGLFRLNSTTSDYKKKKTHDSDREGTDPRNY